MKMYKLLFLVSAVLLLGMMAWCGPAAAMTAPLLVFHALETCERSALIGLAILGATGWITARLSRKIPCPFPQLTASALLAAGVIICHTWHTSQSLAPLMENVQTHFLHLGKLTALLYPAVSLASAFCSLPSLFTKDAGRKNHAVLSLIASLALIITADALAALRALTTLSWAQLVPVLPALSVSHYAAFLQRMTDGYAALPLIPRILASVPVLLVTARALYVAGMRMVQPPAAAPLEAPLPAGVMLEPPAEDPALT